jgi:hypothetical protein
MTTPVLAYPNMHNVASGMVSPVTSINALAIRDTNAHDPTTDVPGTNTFLIDMRYLPGSRVIYVANGLDQTAAITLLASYDGVNVIVVGSSVNVSSATTATIDTYQLPQLSNAYPYVGIRAQCASGPSSGTLTAVVSGATGGGAVTNAGSISLGTTTITGNLPAGTNVIGYTKLVDGPYTTYGAGIAALAPSTAATDIAGLYNNAGGIVKLGHMDLQATQTTTGNIDIYLIKRSAKNTGAAAQTPTPVPYDSYDSAANGVVVGYTANPSVLGASIGTLSAYKITVAAAAAQGGRYVIDFGSQPGTKNMILHQNEGLYVNLNGISVTGGSFDIFFEWTES